MGASEVGVGASRTVSAKVEPGPVPSTWSVTFRSEAVAGTLAAFTGTLSAARLDIISAVIHVSDGSVADTFDVALLDGGTFGPDDADRLAAIAADVLNQRHDLAAELAELRRRQPPRAAVVPRVEVQTGSSLTTGIKVVCADRPGLLYDITSTLSKHGLRTRALSVLTFHEKAHDTFRVVDDAGGPPADGAALEALRNELGRVCA